MNSHRKSVATETTSITLQASGLTGRWFTAGVPHDHVCEAKEVSVMFGEKMSKQNEGM